MSLYNDRNKIIKLFEEKSIEPSNFFSIDILLHIHLNNIKTLLPGANILGVPGKNIKRNS